LASLTTPPTLATTATIDSPAGKYPIDINGAVEPDYKITYVAGTLTVNSPSSQAIAGTVYFDVTGNELTPDDTPFAGAPLVVDTNHNGSPDSDEPKTTSLGDGTYSFPNLAAATYDVRLVVPTGLVRTAPALTGADSVTLTAGQTAGGNDFAVAELCD